MDQHRSTAPMGRPFLSATVAVFLLASAMPAARWQIAGRSTASATRPGSRPSRGCCACTSRRSICRRQASASRCRRLAASALTARTAIGLSRDGQTLTLFTVDVRGGSDGMRLSEVAALLIREFGVWDALNLDGGGSTTMAIETADGGATIANTSFDNPTGREVATSLAVFARRR